MAGNPPLMNPPQVRIPASNEQKQFLLAFMEQNVLFSQGEFRCAMGKEEYRKEWIRLAGMLNALPGGADKTAEKWQTYWSSQRDAVKKRAQDIKHHVGGTGGGPPPTDLLTKYDQRVLTCMGGWKRVIGFSVKDPMEINREVITQIPPWRKQVSSPDPTTPNVPFDDPRSSSAGHRRRSPSRSTSRPTSRSSPRRHRGRTSYSRSRSTSRPTSRSSPRRHRRRTSHSRARSTSRPTSRSSPRRHRRRTSYSRSRSTSRPKSRSSPRRHRRRTSYSRSRSTSRPTSRSSPRRHQRRTSHSRARSRTSRSSPRRH